MYKSLSKEDWLNRLWLPNDYKVDAMLCYGSFNIPKYTKLFTDNLEKLWVQHEKTELTYPFLYTILPIIANNKMIWFTVNYWTAMISELVHIGSLLWSEKNIILGTCWWLWKEVESWDIIVPNYSYGNESAIRMYNRTGDHKQYTNQELSDRITKNLREYDITVFQKPIITCNWMLWETFEDVQERSSAWYYGVEMESATVFAVSNHFNVPSSGMILVSDNLIQNQIVWDESHKQQEAKRKELQEKFMQVAIEEILS